MPLQSKLQYHRQAGAHTSASVGTREKAGLKDEGI
jgi:hypothetical protein